MCLAQVGSTGVGALTLAFIILLVCTLVFVQKSYAAANKSVAYLSIYICGFAAMSYFAMLSGQVAPPSEAGPGISVQSTRGCLRPNI